MAPARRQLPVSSLAIGAGVLIALAVAALTRAA
jgi:hypothetical protein